MSNNQTFKMSSPSGTLYQCQKGFRINKKREKQGEQDVRISDLFKKDIMDAMKELNGNAFKIYMYLISNADDYRGGLSKQAIMNSIDISEKGYRNSIDELVKKGYLYKTGCWLEDSSGARVPLYDFYSTPR